MARLDWVHHVRFSDEDNATDAMRFLIGPIEEKTETEPNDDASEAFKVSALPVVINGVLEKRGAVDTFEIELDEGQTLVASVEANSNLRSPVDATVQILSSKGTVLAQNLDKFGLDPAIEFLSPRKDRFLVRVFGFPETPDSTIGYAGGDNFVYRLTLATGGWVRTIKPMAIQRNAETKFQLVGVNLPQTELTIGLPDKVSGFVMAAVRFRLDAHTHARCHRLAAIARAGTASRWQAAPTDDTRFYDGTISQYSERDFYSFDGKKDTKLSIALTSRRMGMPMDGVIRVLDLSGKQLAREDDTAKEEDAKLIFQPPADGKYVLEVTDAFMAGGTEWVYRIDVQPVQGDVRCTVKADHFTCKVNEELELPVTIDRQNGFDKPLMISLSGIDGNVACEAVKAEKDAKEVKLKLKASAAFRGPVASSPAKKAMSSGNARPLYQLIRCCRIFG